MRLRSCGTRPTFDVYSLLMAGGGFQASGSLPLVPLTPGGLLIPFQPSQTPGARHSILPAAGGAPSSLRNFNDIRQQIQQRAQALANVQQQSAYARIPSPPVLSAGDRNRAAYTSGNVFAAGARSGGLSLPLTSSTAYGRPPTVAPSYAPPSAYASSGGSVGPGPAGPYGVPRR